MIRVLDSLQAIDSILASGELVLLDFYADWCEPCKILDSILAEVNDRLKEEVLILKIDTEIFTGLLDLFEIRSVPVLQAFYRNRLIWRINGFTTADEMCEILQNISRETGENL